MKIEIPDKMPEIALEKIFEVIEKYSPRICKNCGKEFTPQGNRRTFCSIKCSKENDKKQMRKRFEHFAKEKEYRFINSAYYDEDFENELVNRYANQMEYNS